MTAIRFFLVMAVLTGYLYPLSVTVLSQIAFPNQAKGSIIYRDGVPAGSRLIGQEFKSDIYFASRASSINYNPMPSGGSNLSPASKKLRDQIDGVAPAEFNLKMASASGLDPHITPEAAHFQVDRVASTRRLTDAQKLQLNQLVDSATERPDFKLLGEPRVNVLALNIALDQAFPVQ